MDKAEREALAIDIARRVRLLCVQPVPDELIDLLAGVNNRQGLYTKNPRDFVTVDYEVRAGALHIIFMINNSTSMHFRFDRESDVRSDSGV